MLTPYYATLASAQIDGPTVTLAGPSSILPKQAIYTFPAGFFQFIGQMIRIRAAGRISTSATPGTITFTWVLGGTAIFTSQAFTPAVSQTTVAWILDLTGTVRAVDSASAAATTFMCIGQFFGTAATANGNITLPATSPAVGTAVDNTIALTADLQITFGTASVNTIICHQYQLDAQI